MEKLGLEPGEAVRVSFNWTVWLEGEGLTAYSVTCHPDIVVSEVSETGNTVSALVSVPESAPLGHDYWFRFSAEAGTRKGRRTQPVRTVLRPPIQA